jgi:hypothetical protein
MVSLQKRDRIIGELVVYDKSGNPVSKAKVEKFKSGTTIFIIDATDNPGLVIEGFRMGPLKRGN